MNKGDFAINDNGTIVEVISYSTKHDTFECYLIDSHEGFEHNDIVIFSVGSFKTVTNPLEINKIKKYMVFK